MQSVVKEHASEIDVPMLYAGCCQDSAASLHFSMKLHTESVPMRTIQSAYRCIPIVSALVFLALSIGFSQHTLTNGLDSCGGCCTRPESCAVIYLIDACISILARATHYELNCCE